MRVRGRHDNHKINAVGALRLLFRHFAEVCIDARRVGNVPCPSGRAVLFRIACETARAQDSQLVHRCAVAVHIADKRTIAAADHAKA